MKSGRYKAYPENYDSGVEWLGKLPCSWGTTYVKHLLSSSPCYGILKPDKYDEMTGVKVVRILDIANGIVDAENLETVSPALSREYKRTLIEPGDLIVSVVGTLGRSFICSSEHQGMNLSRALARMQLRSPSDGKYLQYLIDSKCFVDYVKVTCTGAAQKVLNMDDLSNWAIPGTDSATKTQIATFLDYETAKIDRLIEKQQALIALLKEKRQAVISHAVTKGLNPSVPLKDSGIEWLGQVPAHWVPSSVKYISANVGTGGTPKKERSFTDAAEVPWFTPGDLNDQGELTSASKHITQLACRSGDAKTYPAGSVIVIGIGATLGKVGYSRQEFSCNQQINIITPNSKISDAYMMHALSVQAEQMRQLSNASTIGIMNQEKTKLIKIAVPPTAEQNLIVEFIDKKSRQYATLFDRASSQITLLQERRTALISAAVTGKIDVRAWQPPVGSGLERAEIA